MVFASTDSGLYTRTAVARLTLALAKLSCYLLARSQQPLEIDPQQISASAVVLKLNYLAQLLWR